jgi:GAF domain-containing protein
MPRRDLTLDDVRTVMALQRERPPGETYKAVERLAKEACGWHLLTILKYVEAEGAVERVSSSDEASYPVGGRKPLDRLTENQRIMDGGEIALAADPAAIQRLFFDHALIASLGITAIMNVPVRHAGRRLGTLNFCGEAGMYGEREKAIGRILAGLLVPALLDAADG